LVISDKLNLEFYLWAILLNGTYNEIKVIKHKDQKKNYNSFYGKDISAGICIIVTLPIVKIKVYTS
jgi:hypothetical protein